MVKSAAILFGIVLLAMGLFGFIPGATINQVLLRTFHLGAFHSVVHIVSGVIAIFCGLISRGAARAFFKIFGIIYALIAIFGFYYGNQPLFKLISYRPDIGLHVVLAATMLFLGFATAKQVA